MIGRARIAALALAACAVLAASPAQARRGEVALTFDDLPALTILDDQPYVDYLTATLLRGLKRHHLPAIGFVNEGKLDEIVRARQIAVLRAWLGAGMDLGNHTFSHETPETLGTEGYIADIAKGEPVTAGLLARRHRTLRWFRHPYLATGGTAEARARIDAWLAQHHYRIAPVTLDASDWMFAEPYDDAIARHDAGRAERIRAEYLAYTDRMIAWHEKAARALFDRQIPLVMLLHATRLNADCIDGLAALLRRDRLRAVSLERAMADPAYATPDTYAGSDGPNWLERWARTLHRPLPWDGYAEPPVDIKAEYDKVDNDR